MPDVKWEMAMLRPGEIFDGTYQVIREIGKGGSGTVYLAIHLRLQKYVVLKRVQAEGLEMKALRLEADLLKNLRHPCLPQIYDFLLKAGEVYTVMDYIEGADLGRIPCGPRHISEGQAVRWFCQLAEVLDYLHTQARPILHSDIKPGNLILTPEGNLCLIDFNISLSGHQRGKLNGFSRDFASPEQIQMAETILAGQPCRMQLDERTDIYSTGGVFYYLLTGMLPKGSAPLKEIPRLPYSPGLCAVVEKCLEPDRRRRYGSAKALIKALKNLKKQDTRYKRYLAVQAVVWLCCGLLASGGVFCVLRGNSLAQRERYNASYNLFCQAVEAEDYDQLLSCGLELLNAPEYQGILCRNPEEKAAVLHEMGDAYSEKENWEGALRCYADATAAVPDGDKSRGIYYLDYAIALTEAGRTIEAESVLQGEAGSCMDRGTRLLLEAYLAARKGSVEDSLETILEIVNSDTDRETAVRACMLAASLKGEDTADGIFWLEQARQYDESAKIMRRLASSYLAGGKKSKLISERKGWAQKALSCYQELCGRPSPAFEDRLGLAVAHYVLGQNEDCIRQLLACAQEGEKDYRIDLYLAFSYDAAGDKVSAASKCSSALRKIQELSSAQKEMVGEEDEEALKGLQRKLGL